MLCSPNRHVCYKGFAHKNVYLHLRCFDGSVSTPGLVIILHSMRIIRGHLSVVEQVRVLLVIVPAVDCMCLQDETRGWTFAVHKMTVINIAEW